MVYMRFKAVTAVALLLSAFCLLAYQNFTLWGNNAALRGTLASEISRRAAVEGLYEKLLEDYYDLLKNYTSLSSEAGRLKILYDGLLGNYSALRDQHAKLVEEYTALNETHSILQRDHMSLITRYIELETAYAALNRSYGELLQELAALESIVRDYEELRAKYDLLLSGNQALQEELLALRGQYEALYRALYEPLWSNMTVTPSLNELREWLAEDDTDKITYKEWDFVCGDYATMLSMHAKLKGWDMGVVAVLGHDADRKIFAHAFNAIRCREGLVYVEPQNDQVFYGPIIEGIWYMHPNYGMIFVEKLIVVMPYQSPL